MQEHFERDRLHHEAIAHEYDTVVVGPRAVGNDVLFRRFQPLVGAGGRMLDVACGTGHMVLRFAPLFAEVVAVDHSAAMQAEARRKVAERRWSNVQFEQADVLEYLDRAPAGHFDLITCVGFLHHLMPEQLPAVMAQLARLLRPGGTLLLSEPIEIAAAAVPPSLDAWNRRSLAARTGYSVEVDDPDEAPLDAELLLRSVEQAGLRVIRQQRSFEVFPHRDPPRLRDRLAIRWFNWRYGEAGNVMTLAAQLAR